MPDHINNPSLQISKVYKYKQDTGSNKKVLDFEADSGLMLIAAQFDSKWNNMANKSLYLSKIQLKAELDRCLDCKTKPCMNACPVNCSPQEFISYAREGRFAEAVNTIARNNPMGQTCGLICPDKFCMKACTRSHIDFSVNIPKVQATILENYRSSQDCSQAVTPTGQNIAIIGAGPAGIAAAASLVREGCKVTIFEEKNEIGGALNLIPDDRLPHDVIEKDWKFIYNPDLITLKLNTAVEEPLDLLDEFDGVIIATGEPNCVNLNIPGEENCISYMEYLHHPAKYKTFGKVAVIGGGNVAADCALTAANNGAAVVEMFVRRRLSDMRISKHEYLELINHMININPLSSPEKIEVKNGSLSLYICKNHLKNGKFEPLPNSSIELPEYDLVIKAIGSFADPKSDDERIIYAGDCKHGGSTIVEAIASGRDAALLMSQKLALAAE